MERKMEFALPCETSNLEEQFCGAAQPKRQVRWSRGWHRGRSYCTVSCHGNNLNRLMWGSLIVTNTVTETRLSSCSGKSTQSTYRPILFPWFTVSSFVLLAGLASWRTDYCAVLLCPGSNKPMQSCVGCLKHLWNVRSSPPYGFDVWWECKVRMCWSCTIENCFSDFYLLIKYSVCITSQFVASTERRGAEGVSSSIWSRLMIFASAVLAGAKTMGSRHLPLGAPHFIGAMKRQRLLSAGQSSHANSWLDALPSLRSRSGCFWVSLHLSLGAFPFTLKFKNCD